MTKVFNPYIAGNPVRKESDFFGRKDVFERVTRELSNPSSNSVVLFGQRRIGKTSLLLQLENRLPQDEFLAIYFDLQDQAARSLGKVLNDLASTIASKANLKSLDLEFDDTGRIFTESFLPDLYKVFGNRRLVILFDEFDVLDQIDETGLPQTAAAKGLFPFLRNLMSIGTNLAFVFVVGRRVDDLQLNTISLFKASVSIDIWLLDPESIRNLILKAEESGTLKFNENAIQKIISLTNGHPYLSQLICQRMWNNACLREGVNYPVLVNEEMVEAVVLDSLDAGDVGISWIWEGLGPAEKIYAAALAESSKNGMGISESEISRVLTANAMRLRSREIEVAPKDLVKRKILVPIGDDRFKFAVELFRIWIEKNHSIKDVKDELDRIEPEADGLYKLGSQSLKKRQLSNALEYFQKALEKNNNHFQARLGLGEVLFEQGVIDDAVSTFRLAYSLDAEEAKLPLVRALLTQAHNREEQGYLTGVVESCDSIIKIAPNEETAVIMRAKAKRLLDFAQRMDVIIMRSDDVVEERTPLLITLLSERLARQIMNYAVKPSLHEWRDGKLRSLNDVKSRIKDMIADWLATDDAQTAIASVVSPWLNGIGQEIILLMRAVYKDFNLYFHNIDLSGGAKVNIDQDLSADSLQINFDNTIGVVTGTIIGMLVGGGIIALFFTPLVGDEILGVILALLFVPIAVGLGVSESIKEGAEKWASTKDLPNFLRESFLTDEKIQQILYTGESKMREEIDAHLRKTFIENMQKQLSNNIRNFLDLQREKIKEIIK